MTFYLLRFHFQLTPETSIQFPCIHKESIGHIAFLEQRCSWHIPEWHSIKGFWCLFQTRFLIRKHMFIIFFWENITVSDIVLSYYIWSGQLQSHRESLKLHFFAMKLSKIHKPCPYSFGKTSSLIIILKFTLYASIGHFWQG